MPPPTSQHVANLQKGPRSTLRNGRPTHQIPLTPDVVDLIHRGPLERSPWSSFLRELQHLSGADFACISIRPGRQDSAPVVLLASDVEIDRGVARKVADAHSQLAHLDPLASALQQPGDVFSLDEIVSWPEFTRTAFYRKVLAPYGIRHQLGMHVATIDGWECHLGVMSLEESGPFGPSHRSLLLSILPYFAAALSTFVQLHRQEFANQIANDTLRSLAFASFILDGTGRIIDQNETADILLDKQNMLSVCEGRLKLSTPSQQGALNRLIESALVARRRGRRDAFAEGMSASAPAARRLNILVRSSLRSRAAESDFAPQVVVLVSDLQAALPVPAALIGQLFGLTPTESKLTSLLSQGLTLTQAASALNVQENTARSYSKRIYARLGLKRQHDLVRRVLTSLVMLA